MRPMPVHVLNADVGASRSIEPERSKPKRPTHRRTRPRAIAFGCVLAPALAAIVVSIAHAAPDAPELTASATPDELTYGTALSVTGFLLQAGRGVQDASLALQADAYPFRRFVTVARLQTMADGSYAFSGVKPNRNTRMRVVEEGTPGASSRELAVTVDPLAALNAVSLGRGRTRLSLRVSHTREGGSPSVDAWWFAAARGTRLFHLVAVTPTRELSPGVTYASTTIDPPAKRFAYRVCLNPTWEHAMGAPGSHGPCPEHDYLARGDAA